MLLTSTISFYGIPILINIYYIIIYFILGNIKILMKLSALNLSRQFMGNYFWFFTD